MNLLASDGLEMKKWVQSDLFDWLRGLPVADLEFLELTTDVTSVTNLPAMKEFLAKRPARKMTTENVEGAEEDQKKEESVITSDVEMADADSMSDGELEAVLNA